MSVSAHLAKHIRAVHFGGNWTSINLKDLLFDVTWQEATTKVQNLNTILALTYHVSYYVTGVLEVFQNRPLEIRDKFSYNHPSISSGADWRHMLDTIYKNAETLAQHIEAIPESQIWEDFVDAKYGNYFSNINGIIEHTHYHLGQIAVIKKLLRTNNS
ncbi:hypothetical protein SAMN04515667_1149 [Formosa sp. Hel1_31_208]|uniref:DUF1572 domain-containing protein n=1 Tax=Formosa sp. Hel1_31_208 TaxID=1798225 RepID=UPI00087B76AE|nr:DUF1572 domain-containing protein [Formosa sp. Hel1_31_208]SDR98765.1 hypothetical protein SAMN04515667_1149 [Formosa sp. Hel1_31_208]